MMISLRLLAITHQSSLLKTFYPKLKFVDKRWLVTQVAYKVVCPQACPENVWMLCSHSIDDIPICASHHFEDLNFQYSCCFSSHRQARHFIATRCKLWYQILGLLRLSPNLSQFRAQQIKLPYIRLLINLTRNELAETNERGPEF